MGCSGSKETKRSHATSASPSASTNTSARNTQNEKRDDQPEYVFKCLVVGEISVGKSNLVRRFTSGKFYGEELPPTTNDYVQHDIKVNGALSRLKIWDTAGQEKFDHVTASYYRGSSGALICFDLGRPNTSDKLQKWVDQVNAQAMSKVSKVIVGCKSDADIDETARSTAKSLAEKHSLQYFEVSAQSGANVADVWEALTKECQDAKKEN